MTISLYVSWTLTKTYSKELWWKCVKLSRPMDLLHQLNSNVRTRIIPGRTKTPSGVNVNQGLPTQGLGECSGTLGIGRKNCCDPSSGPEEEHRTAYKQMQDST